MTGILIDYARLALRACEFGFRRANFDDLQSGLALAEHLTEQTMATPESISWIDGITGMAGWVTGDPVDGVFITVPLSAQGVAAVRDGSFVPAWPALMHLACEGDPCGGVYIGVYAGITKETRRAVVMAAGVTRVEFFAPVPCFARGATEAGKRSMTSLGFQPIDGGLPDLWGQEPLPAAQEKAA